MRSINPYTQELIAEYEEHRLEEVRLFITKADRAQQLWANNPLSERVSYMRALALTLRSQKAELARLMTSEMGKPISESLAEVEKCAWLAEYLSEESHLGLDSRDVITEARHSYVTYEALGLILAVMPWNFPLWQVLRLSLPAIVAGNGILLKHASNVWGTALSIEKLFIQAGFPDHLFTTLLLTSKSIEPVVAHPAVRAVSLTGSESAGKSIAATAGRYLKKAVLELGGSDAFLVLPDAELQEAAVTAMQSRMLNSGQVCISAKRFLIHEDIFDDFVDAQIDLLSQLSIGDPMLPTTHIGPLARPELLLQLEAQLQASLQMGAICIYGGKRFNSHPQILEPSLLIDIQPDMPVWSEETFGPVMPLMRFKTLEEGIRIANDSRFGLGASIWTGDLELAKAILPKIEAGSVYVNSMVKSDPRLPFGGIKHSGFGRELSVEGIKEFVNIKTNWIN